MGTITSLWDANMDLLSPTSGINIYDTSWPIYTHSAILPAQFIGSDAVLSHCLVTDGCEVHGTIENSVLFHSVTVEPGATVRYSILMPGATVKAGATVEYAIVGENTTVGCDAVVGNPPDGSDDWGVAVVAADVADGQVIPANAMYSEKQKGAVLGC